MKHLLLILALFGLFVGSLQAQVTWVQKDTFPGGDRINPFAFSIGEKGYIGGGGIITALVAFDDLWEYDPHTDTWTERAKFPGTPRTQAIGFSIGDKGYMGLGIQPSGGYLKDFWEYDPVADKWTQLADFPGRERDYAIGFGIDGYGYMGLGVRIAQGQRDFYRYDPALDEWTARAGFPGDRRINMVGFAINGKGYAGLGAQSTNPPVWPNDIWEYDPVADAWTATNGFTGPTRNQGVGFALKHLAVVGFGNSATGLRRDFYLFDPVQDTWTELPIFPQYARNAAIGLSIGNFAFTGLGNNGSRDLKDFWQIKDIIPENLRVEETPDFSQSSIRIYPNPVVTESRIVLQGYFPAGRLELFTSDGEWVQEWELTPSKEFQLNREGLPSGVYLLRYSSHTGVNFHSIPVLLTE